jgi:hypothetical protein
MITAKDIFIEQRIREEIANAKLQRLGQEAYLTVRKEQMISQEAVKKPVKK